MKSGSTFFRSDILFPKNFGELRKPVYTGWITSGHDFANEVDRRVRTLGWHFMWLVLYSTRFGIGLSSKAALDRAMQSGLGDLQARFNTAELMDVKIKSYLGIHLARVKLASRHIQEHASLGLVDEAVFRVAPSLVNAQAS